MIATQSNNGMPHQTDRPAIEPLLVGAKDLARILAISEATLLRWDQTGELGPEGIKKLGRRLWPVAEVRAWVAAGMPVRERWLTLKPGHAEI